MNYATNLIQNNLHLLSVNDFFNRLSDVAPLMSRLKLLPRFFPAEGDTFFMSSLKVLPRFFPAEGDTLKFEIFMSSVTVFSSFFLSRGRYLDIENARFFPAEGDTFRDSDDFFFQGVVALLVSLKRFYTSRIR